MILRMTDTIHITPTEWNNMRYEQMVQAMQDGIIKEITLLQLQLFFRLQYANLLEISEAESATLEYYQALVDNPNVNTYTQELQRMADQMDQIAGSSKEQPAKDKFTTIANNLRAIAVLSDNATTP